MKNSNLPLNLGFLIRQRLRKLSLPNATVFLSTSKQTELVSREASKLTSLDITNPWQRVQDKSSQQYYYWNSTTNETTAVGAPRPQFWVELKDPSGDTEATYWWNPETKQTTPLGSSCPQQANNMIPPSSIQYGSTQVNGLGRQSGTDSQSAPSMGKQLVQTAVLGFVFTTVFVLIRSVIG